MIYLEIGLVLVAFTLGVITRVKDSRKVRSVNSWRRFALEITLEILPMLGGISEMTEYYAEEYIKQKIDSSTGIRQSIECADFHLR